MRVNVKLLTTLAVALILGGVVVAKAADTDTKTPGAQGLESIDKNLRKHPDNRGLENAQDRHERNQERRAAHKAHKIDRDDKVKAERPEKAERADKADRPERASR